MLLQGIFESSVIRSIVEIHRIDDDYDDAILLHLGFGYLKYVLRFRTLQPDPTFLFCERLQNMTGGQGKRDVNADT